MEDLSRQIDVLEKKANGGKSPLFAQLAAFYLESGRAKDALRVCEDGLANYPFYATGHLVRGKALVALKMNAEARREFSWVVDFMPGNAAAHQLLDQVPPGDDETLTMAAPTPFVSSIPTPTAPAAEPSFELPKDDASPFGLPAEAPATTGFDLPTDTPTNDFGISTEAPASGGFDLPTEAPAMDFGTTPTAQPQPDFGGFGGLSEAPLATPEASPFDAPAAPADDPFGFGAPPPAESTPDPFAATSPEPQAFTGFDAPSPEPAPFTGFDTPSPEPSTFTGFDAPSPEPAAFTGFDAPSPEPMFTPEPAAEQPAPDFSFAASPSEEESFEAYAMRMRGELTGENSMSLDEYLSAKQPDPLALEPQPQPSSPSIEELANSLQSAKKITPVINFATKSTTTVSESDTPASTGFVTPTLAEIYAKQGWFDDAIKAYKTLANNKPAERDKFMARIAELEEQKKQSEG